jgi:hypothetical protein
VHLILNFEWLPEELLKAVNIASCEGMSSNVFGCHRQLEGLVDGGMRKSFASLDEFSFQCE